MPSLLLRAATLLVLLVVSPAPAAAFDHVLIISVDGLRSDALMPGSRTALPNLRRLGAGSSTLNARTDPAYTMTLPNHTSMMTGRDTRGPGGHGCMTNVFAAGNPLLHELAGAYLPGIFDVAHDHGVHAALVAAKTKFGIYDDSWDKIDRYRFCPSSTAVTDAALETLAAGHERTLLFVHYAAPDIAGHTSGWDLTPGSDYLESIDAVDAQIGRVLEAARAAPLAGRIAIILTADHGGGAPHRSHLRAEMWVNYIIPFLVWLGDDAEPADLYELNAKTRRDPGLEQPRAGADPAPIRNGDAANLALHLLGLPAIEGSTINVKQDLAVRP